MITIVDYGSGNLRSVSKALESLGAKVNITSEPRDVEAAEKLILPGVGAFPAAMAELRSRELIEPLQAYLQSGRPYLGICLGLQLLFETSEEGGGGPGLGALKGSVKRFADVPALKVPHMGWNRLEESEKAPGAAKACPLLRGLEPQSFVYFVHSYYADPRDRALSILETDYGVRFTSMVWKDRIFATQFHPEKSQAVGLKILKNFVAYNG